MVVGVVRHHPREALQKNIASLENGKHCLCFSSGMGAIDTVIKLLAPGDEVITGDDLYGGSYRMFTKIFMNCRKFLALLAKNEHQIVNLC